MSYDKYGDGPDPYTYPNSQVLINKFGIIDDDQFMARENYLVGLPYDQRRNLLPDNESDPFQHVDTIKIK
ncbi:hypothetical protein [Yersinia bercovieri]|uniref:hypothetical protein n=1 Tax=Yersinia bercovieri TaxID=634 RepID=UPI0021BDBD65|nr:hypothetical protein [Yersinia bercovieri]